MNKRSGIQSKKNILDAAMRVFCRHGYAGASIREIAKTADISIGGVYLYFRNKEDLYLSLIKNRVVEQEKRIREIVKSSGSSSHALSAFLSGHLEYSIKHKESILTHIREHGFTFGLEIKRRFFRNQIGLLTDILKKGIKDGEFRECNVNEAARIVMAALRGISLSMAIDGVRIISAKGIGELMLKGLSKDGIRKSEGRSEKQRGRRGSI
ncbi:MAG: TetR/AcrR family transcriptional regulator [Nitrospirota bacterium]